MSAETSLLPAKRPNEDVKQESDGDLERLRKELEEARARVAALESAYATALKGPPGLIAKVPGKPVRVFLDGAFDLTHFGHMNAFRQARLLGDQLIVGVNSSASVAECKGSPPVLTDEERQAVVAGCRFVDEIVPESPYIMTAEYIQHLIDDKGVDCFVHGDDPCIVDGKDVYEAAKKAGRYRSIPRTEGISTTDLVGRMLLLSKDHHEESPSANKQGTLLANISLQMPAPEVVPSQQSKFLVTSQLMKAFSAALPGHMTDRRRAGVKTVYADGAWDMFHAGHMDFLRKARALGDRLLVGVHSDAVVNEHAGTNRPVMALHERVLSVLGCRHVDDVLLDAPWEVTQEMVSTLGLDVVVRGTVHDCLSSGAQDPHSVPKALGIHVEVSSEVDLSIETIVQRVQDRRSFISARFEKKRKIEEDWYKQKHGL